MGNWDENVAIFDPNTGESADKSQDDSHEARQRRLRIAEAFRRWDAGDIDGAMKLLSGEKPEGESPPLPPDPQDVRY